MPKQTWKTLAPQLRLVWQLSLPAILTQITTIAMQYIDSAMVGALGADASAAIGLVAVEHVAVRRRDDRGVRGLFRAGRAPHRRRARTPRPGPSSGTGWRRR